MDYLIKWQFTKENSVPFKTQAEIIISVLTPLVEDKSFLTKASNLYISKQNFTDVRFHTFCRDEYVSDVQKIVKGYTRQLKRTNLSECDGQPKETKFTFSKNSLDCEENFYKYLGDITWIGIGLHKKDLPLAVPIAVKARYETKPLGELDPREVLERHFSEASEQYREKNKEEFDKFWSNCGFFYDDGKGTRGDHFYYNIVLGIEPLSLLPCQRLLEGIMNLFQSHNIEINFPGSLQCWEAIAFLINKALKDP